MNSELSTFAVLHITFERRVQHAETVPRAVTLTVRALASSFDQFALIIVDRDRIPVCSFRHDSTNSCYKLCQSKQSTMLR